MGFLSDLVKSITGAIGDVVGWLLGIEEPDYDDQNRGALVNKQSNVAAIPVIYGTRKVGGTRVFVSTGGGKKNEYLYIALALCEGEIDSIGDVYINDVLSTDSKFSGLVTIEKYTGTDSQTYSTLLAEADDTWGSSHRLRGVAYLAVRFKYDPDVFSSIPEIQAVVRGKKVYNPDTFLTAYSSNPAYCLRDYLTNTRYGKGLSSSLVDDASFIAAADFCDTTVTSSSGLGGSQKIFECNVVIDTGNKLFDNVKVLLRGMRGLMPYSNGEYSLLIDKAEGVTFDLTPDNITSAIQVASAGKEKKYNKVIAKFTNPDANWQSDTVFWPPSGSTEESTFATEDDNQELSTEINLPTITNYYSARDIARIACLASRKNALTVKLTATSEALSIAAGDVVRLEHPSMGWTDNGVTDARETFRVAGLQLVNTGEVKLTLQQYDSTIYPWEVGSDQPDSEVSTLPDPTLVAPPTNLSVIAGARVEVDGTTLPYLDISWTAADDAFVDKYEVTVTPSSGNAVTLTVTGTAYRYFVTDSTLTYVVSVRSLNSLGFRSTALSSSSVSAVVDTTAPSAPSSASVTGTFKQIEVRWTNPSDADFSYVEIKRSGTAVEGDAVVVAQTRGDYYIDGPYEGIVTRYYWLRSIDYSGNASSWVYAGTASSVKLVADDFDDGVIAIDYLTTSVQSILNNSASDSDLSAGIEALRQDILKVEVESGDVLNLEDGQDFLIQNLGDVAIYVNESNQIINSSIDSVRSTVTGLEATLVDLVSGVSDVYVKPEPPVAGVDGIPDPIPTFSRWYDSDDNNAPYYWDDTEWVSLADPRIASNAASITTLQSGLNTANSNISANSTAITALDTLTVTQGESITSLSADVTTLQSDLTTAEGDITTNATAISGLGTRVTSAEGTITTLSSDVTTLETSVTDLETDTTANSTAISALDTRVTQTETDITTNATDITALETTVNDETTGVAANASAISALDTRVTTAEGAITSQSTDITSLQNTVDDPVTGVSANASAISSLDSRVTVTESGVSANSSDITDLQTTVNDETTGVVATADAVSALDTRVTTAEGTIDTHSTDISALQVTVDDPDTGVTANAEAISSLDARVTVNEGDISTTASDTTALQVSFTDLTRIQGESDAVITTEDGTELVLNLPTDVAQATSAANTLLDARVTQAEGTIVSQSTQITQLQSDLTTLDGEQTGTATALTSLTTRVTEAEGAITVNSSDITSLESSLTTANSDISTNSTAISSLDTRVTSAEGTITSNSSLITALESSLSDTDTAVAGNSTAISGLDTRVTAAEGTITSQASDITTLQSSLSAAEGDITANADAISSIDTRVTATEDTIASQSTSITALESSVSTAQTTADSKAKTFYQDDAPTADGDGDLWFDTNDGFKLYRWDASLETPAWVEVRDEGISGNATAISALDTRVTAAEGTITSQSTSITALQSDVSTAQTTADSKNVTFAQDGAPASANDGDLWADTNDGNKLYRWDSSLETPAWVEIRDSGISGNATAISSLDTRVTAAEDTITSQATSITTLTSDVGTAQTTADSKAKTYYQNEPPATAEDGDLWFDLNAGNRLYRWDGSLETPAWVSARDTGISGNATAISGLDTRVTQNEDDITSQATAFTTLSTTVNGHTTSISENITSIDGIKAQYTVTIDNNDHISGFGLVSDIIDGEPTSAFIVNAEQFAIGGAGVITDEYPFVVYTENTNVTKDGTSYTIPAGVYIADAFIQTAAIDSAQIRNAAITEAKIDDAAITTAKIDDLAVGTIKIANGAVTNKYAAYTDGGVTVSSTTYVKVQEISSADFDGGSISILFNCKLEDALSNRFDIRLSEDSQREFTAGSIVFTQVFSGFASYSYLPNTVTLALTIQPEAGTYDIEVYSKRVDTAVSTPNHIVSQRFLQVIENKK
jgi:predicted phage tail protein